MIKRILIVVGVLVLAGLMFWKLQTNKAEMVAKAEISAEKVTEFSVETATAETKVLNSDFEGLGSFEPSKEMNFLSETQGRVIEVKFKEGETIREGQVVARVDDEYQRNELAGAELQLSKSRADVGKLENLIKAGGANAQQAVDARFGIESIQNKIASANILLRKSEIKAPMTGVVFKKLIEPGSVLGAGSPIAVLLNMDKVKFVANLAEDEVVTTKVGQTVRIKADVYPNFDYTGKVTLIGLRANDAKKFAVEIELPNNTAHYIRGGMAGKAFFKRPNSKSALVVPRNAIVGSLQDAKIWTLDANNVVHSKSVQTGEVHDEIIEIKTGVAAGEKVIISGQFNLVEGAKVLVAKK